MVRATQKQWFAQSGLLVHGLMQTVYDGDNQLSVKYYLWVAENSKASTDFVLSCLESAKNDLMDEIQELDADTLEKLDP